MKRFILLTALATILLGNSVQAQVRVKVNGEGSFIISQTNGLYFSHDTMRVDDAVYPLDEIRVITLTPVTQGIASAESETMHVVPNPARETITLQGIGDTPQTVALYSTAGVKLMEQHASDGTRLDISHLPEGLYLLRCGNRVAKIVKQL